MAFKMKHKWQNMYSGMAADKLKFIQDTKSGDGKSMAKQTGTTPIDKNKLQKEAQDKADAAMKAGKEKEVESDREGYKKYEKSGTGSAERETKFTPEGNKAYAAMSQAERDAQDKKWLEIQSKSAKASESRYEKIPEDTEPDPDPKPSAMDRYKKFKEENPQTNKVKASEKQFAGNVVKNKIGKGFHYEKPTEEQKKQYNLRNKTDFNKDISNSKFVSIDEEADLNKGPAGETVLANTKDLSKMSPSEIVAYNKAQKKANRKKS